MQINNIKLENFKSFEKLDIDIGKMNILVGANASGKSNFLEAIKFLRDIQRHGIENAISLQGGFEYLQNIQLGKEKSTKISVEFGVTSEVFPYLLQNENVFFDIKSKCYSIEISSTSNNKFKIINETFIISLDFREVESLKSHDSIEEFMNQSHFLGSYDILFSTKKDDIHIECQSNQYIELKLQNNKIDIIKIADLPIFPFSIEFVKQKFDSTESILKQFSLLTFDLNKIGIYDFDLKSSKKPASITAKADLEENGENLALVIKNILNDEEKRRSFSNYLTDMLPFIEGLEIEKSYNNSLLFKVKEKFSPDTYIPSSLLSDGTVSITAIITALLFQNKDLSIFEEPEQGVHPSLIAKLVQLFYEASEEKQVIITTHNPEILKHSKIEDLLLVTRDENGFAVMSRPSELEMVKSFLESELGIDDLFVQNLLDV